MREYDILVPLYNMIWRESAGMFRVAPFYLYGRVLYVKLIVKLCTYSA